MEVVFYVSNVRPEGNPVGLIEDFIARYRKEYDFYEQAARLVAQLLEGRLQAAGVRSIVTSRAKAVGRLEPKLRQRDKKKPYKSIEDIFDDIVDLAGARVALYFPGQREQVQRIVDDLFVIAKQKEFPEGPAKQGKRFGGYFATHYRVRIKEALLSEAQKRYSDALIEIQVASVLMHAWAEVEHDLVYKPLQGELSPTEHAILDEVNGLAMAGELALERLQEAGETRVAAGGRGFANHFELAAHLLSKLKSLLPGAAGQSGLGRIDLLYDLLARLGLATPDGVSRYLAPLHSDVEKRPIAEQIIDQLLAEDAGRYEVFSGVRAARPVPSDFGAGEPDPMPSDERDAIGAFISSWIELERLLYNVHPPEKVGKNITVRMSPSRIVRESGATQEDVSLLERLRRLRNEIVHGGPVPPAAELLDAAKQVEDLKARVAEALSRRPRPEES